MKFSTFGPFHYVEQSPASTVLLFNCIEATRTNLEHGVGIYIFTAKTALGKIRPLYVGKSTHMDFGGRIVGHLNKEKFIEPITLYKGIAIYLVAAVDASGELKNKTTLSNSEAEHISQIEYSFIGSAAAQNPELLNIHGKGSSNFIRKPGLLDDTDPLGSASAKELSKLLGIQ